MVSKKSTGKNSIGLKSVVFFKDKKLEKSVARLRKRRKDTQISKIRNENWDVATDTTEI